MPAGVLYPEDVGSADAARVLDFVNTVETATTLAETVGFAEGPGIGRLVAEAILAQREAGAFATLAELDAVTGVNPLRFTEIVTALSGARPPRALPAPAAAPRGGRPFRAIRIRPARRELWLGQSVGVTVQLVDAAGRGVPGAPVTCVTSWGTICGRHRAERQRGASVALVTEPGGVVSLELAPPIAPPLGLYERAALEAELARLPADAMTPGAAAEALAAFAAHYRADGSEALRGAVDRLLAILPAEPAAPDTAWPILPVTLIAVAGAESGVDGAIDSADAVAVATVRMRGWLGGWLDALRTSIEGNDRIESTLRHLPLEDLTGAEIARGVLGASRAIAGLERGAAARALRDAAANAAVARYLSRNATQVEGEALTHVVRAAGASNAAIASGGFAVFNAIESVQEVQGSIAGRRTADGGRFETRFGTLEGRLARVEETAVDRDALDTFRSDLLAAAAELDTAQRDELRAEIATRADETESRLAAVERGLDSRATGSELAELSAEVEGRFAQIEQRAVMRTDLTALEERLTTDVRRRVDALREEFAGGGIIADIDTRVRDLSAQVTRLSETQITRNDLAALEDRLGRSIASDIGSAVGDLRSELVPHIEAKAEAAAVGGLQRSVSELAANREQITRRLDGVDARIRDLNTRIRRGPIR